MKILLLGVGDVPVRTVSLLSYCENYIDRNTGGHNIITFGYNKGTDICINPEDDFSKVIELLPDGWTPNLCILWGVEWNLLPKGIESAPCPTVAVIFDPDFDLPLVREIVRKVDLTVTIGEFEKEILHALGARDTAVFYYQGIMKEYFHDSPPPVKKRKYDILYTTAIDDEAHPDRSKWILRLSSLADKYNICIRLQAVNYKDYIRLLQDSKIVLSHHRYGSMSMRLLEAGAVGTVTLETGSDVEKYFIPGEEFIPVTEENIAEQIEKYLKDEDRLQRMSERVHSKVIAQYEAIDRFSDLIKFVAGKVNGKRNKRAARNISEHETHISRGAIYYHSFCRNMRQGPFIFKFADFLNCSIEEFKKAVAVEATPGAVTDLAVALATRGFLCDKDEMVREGWKEVVSLLERAISVRPSYVQAYFNLGLVNMRVNNFDEALNAFNAALAVMEKEDAEMDPWRLFPRDYDLFGLWKPLTDLLISADMGAIEADAGIKDLYRAAIYYFVSLAEAEKGNIYDKLDALTASYNLYPRSRVVIRELAGMLPLLGYKEEGLSLNKEAVDLFPFDIDFRINYITLLYAYENDRDAVEEIRRTMDLTRTVGHLKGKAAALKETADTLSRFDETYNYFDICKYKLLNKWLSLLHKHLKKAPGDIRLVLRIADIWRELGMADKVYDIIDQYAAGYLNEDTPGDVVQAIRDLYDYLQSVHEKPGRLYEEKLNKLNDRISPYQKINVTD